MNELTERKQEKERKKERKREREMIIFADAVIKLMASASMIILYFRRDRTRDLFFVDARPSTDALPIRKETAIGNHGSNAISPSDTRG